MDYIVYTYGNGEILKSVFDAIAMCVNSEDGTLYRPLLMLGMLVGLTWAIVQALYSDLARLFTHWVLPFTLINGLLLVPHTTVHIVDVVHGHKPYTVDHVPYGLAMFASYTSRIGYGVTEQVEKVFHQPDDLKYQKTGYIFSSNLIMKTNQFRITNADLADNMHSFVNECVVHDVMLGRKYTVNDLKHSDDLWKLVSQNASPIRHFMWREPRKEGEFGQMARPISCKAGIAKFDQQWPKALKTSADLLGKKVFSSRGLVDPRAELIKYLPLTHAQLGLMSKDATDIIKQQIMINSFVKETDRRSSYLGNTSNFAVQRAYLGQRATYQTLGAFAGDNLPILKAVMESIVYSSFIFLIFLAILPFGWRVLGAFAQIVVWLQFWPPLYAILNYIMMTRATDATMAAMSISNTAGVTIANSVAILDANADISATAGFLSLSIPFISYALLRGVGSFVSLASHLGHVGQGAASSAATEAVSGNYSFGNIAQEGVQISNRQMFNQSMAASYRAGSFHMADGQVEATTMADGSQIMNISSSNLPTSVTGTKSQSKQLSNMANRNYQKALNQSESSAASLASSYRDMVDLSNTIGNSHQATDAMSQGILTEDSKAIHKSANMINEFAKQHNISTDKAASLFAEVSAGAGIIVKSSMGGKTSVNSSDQELLNEAQRVTESEDFQEAQRSAIQAARNYSHNASDETSKRLADSVSGSYEKGMQLREEAAKSYSQAESYNKQAMFTKANSASINSNYNQQFVEWLSNQRADGTDGIIGRRGAGHIIANEPELAGAYAYRFMEERGIIPDSSVGLTAQSVRNSYDNEAGHRQHDVTKESLEDVRNQGHSKVTSHKLDRKELFSGTVNHQIDQQRDKIKSGEDSIRSKHKHVSGEFKDVEGRSVIINSLKKGSGEIGSTLNEVYDQLTKK